MRVIKVTFIIPQLNERKKILTFPQFMYSTAVSRKKKYTKSPCVIELTKFGARRNETKDIKIIQL